MTQMNPLSYKSANYTRLTGISVTHAPGELAPARKNAGAKGHLISWALKELRCPICESRVRPNTRRPGVLPRSMKFDQTVGCDLFEIDEFGFQAVFLNVIRWGTGYQQACRVPDKTPATVAKAFAELWHKHYSVPEFLIMDQGPEFQSSVHDLCREACMPPPVH